MKKQVFKTLSIINRYRFLIVLAVGVALFVLVALNLRAIANPQVDKDHLRDKQQELPSRQINISADLVDALNSLSDTKVKVAPKDLGTKDPFNP